MRKIFAFILILGILTGLCGCSRQNYSVQDSDSSSEESQSVSSSAEYSDETSNSSVSNTDEITANDGLTESSSGTPQTTTGNKVGTTAARRTNAPTTSKSAATTKPDSHSEPTPLDISKSWDSLYGNKEWQFFTTDPSRQWFEGSTASVCRFTAGQDLYANIDVESYCLLDKWKYPLKDDDSLQIFNGQKYVQTYWSGYRGCLFTTVGSEDIVTLELRCYDATGHNWLSDELKFKRTGNNSLKLISGDYKEFKLKNGDVFVR